jgi:hypothetical protein
MGPPRSVDAGGERGQGWNRERELDFVIALRSRHAIAE